MRIRLENDETELRPDNPQQPESHKDFYAIVSLVVLD